MIFATSQMTQKDEGFLTGIIFLAISVLWFAVFLFWPRSQQNVCWGKGGRGAPVSRVGWAAWAVGFALVGLMAIYGTGGQLPVWFLATLGIAAFLVIMAAGYYDNRSKRH